MEHRHHVRIPIGIKTLIYRRGLPIATGRIRNGSRGGLFIETECVEMGLHQRVQCEVPVAEDAGAIGHCVSVRVVRQAPGGAGVELDEDDEPVAGSMLAYVTGDYPKSGA